MKIKCLNIFKCVLKERPGGAVHREDGILHLGDISMGKVPNHMVLKIELGKEDSSRGTPGKEWDKNLCFTFCTQGLKSSKMEVLRPQ